LTLEYDSGCGTGAWLDNEALPRRAKAANQQTFVMKIELLVYQMFPSFKACLDERGCPRSTKYLVQI